DRVLSSVLGASCAFGLVHLHEARPKSSLSIRRRDGSVAKTSHVDVFVGRIAAPCVPSFLALCREVKKEPLVVSPQSLVPHRVLSSSASPPLFAIYPSSAMPSATGKAC